MPSVEGRSFEVALFEQSRRLVQLLSIEFRISKPDQPVNQVLSGSEYYLISVFKVCVFFFFFCPRSICAHRRSPRAVVTPMPFAVPVFSVFAFDYAR